MQKINYMFMEKQKNIQQIRFFITLCKCAFNWKGTILFFFFFFLMIRRPPRSTHCISSAASDVYKRQINSSPVLSESSIVNKIGKHFYLPNIQLNCMINPQQ
eukprot:TRINITY_DN1030_c0_g1_i5.p2 TRINITY_DN1030_c0_g1~~TRINITY_DN1030_c0_g1_i5.p2  ORF type:complete len:102 (+),score=35.48 TRINITY_DN1030_c0_g1_i5:236-541(+)